jgi:cytochrome c oxidase subunit II
MKRLSACGATLLLAACAQDQSVLAPQGPDASRIADLAWTLFAMAAGVLLIVLLALAAALRGSAAWRARLARPGTVIAAGIVFPAVVLSALLAYDVWLARGHATVALPPDTLRIEVTGEQWWWRVAYVDARGQRIASANELRIPVGRSVELSLASADVIHSFWVPRLAGKLDMIPGRTTRLHLRADHAGIFRGQCAEYCGGAHALMAFEVIALAPDEFETWLRREAAAAAEPSSEAGRQGRELFLAAGCGGCHAIRGTEASGTIGPDLTRLASRRWLGANTLRLTADNLALFIAGNQHLKPGNRMPDFRVFSPEELSALTAYLAELD